MEVNKVSLEIKRCLNFFENYFIKKLFNAQVKPPGGFFGRWIKSGLKIFRYGSKSTLLKLILVKIESSTISKKHL